MVSLKREHNFIENDFVVSFKGDFLDQLVDACALLEVASKLISHHKDMDIDPQTFSGLALLMDRVKELLDINANLLPETPVSSRVGGMRNPEAH